MNGFFFFFLPAYGYCSTISANSNKLLFRMDPINTTSEKQVVDEDCTGPASSGSNTRRRRARAPSSSSGSSSSTSSSSSTNSSDFRSKKRKRSHRHRNKKGKRTRRNDEQLARLSRQVSDLKKQISYYENSADNLDAHNGQCVNVNYPSIDQGSNFDDNVIDDSVSGILYNDESRDNGASGSQLSFDFGIETKLKEPAVPKAPEKILKTLQDIQYFDKPEWCEVRYAEVQKSYNLTPGFVDLEVNEEVKAYDSSRHLTYSDKAYAALTLCALKQRDALQSSLQELLTWARDQNELNVESMHEKLLDLFSKGNYSKVSSDLLQMVCGHRAEVIQMRRDGITNMVRDPLVKSALRKVPPSSRHLFSQEDFTKALEKAGGVKKAFLPLKSNSGPVSQTGSYKSSRHPPQGSAIYPGPSQGPSHGCCAYLAHNSRQQNYQPSQGYSHNNRPSQGYVQNNSDRRTVHNSRGTFRSRGGRQGNRPSDQGKGNRKRPGNASENNSSKKRKY